MNKKPQTKKIKIVSKGIVTTSRGRCRTPILTPYVENVNSILSMLTRDKATIVEVLPDKREIELNIYNFSQDNAIRDPITKKVAPAHVADPKVVHAGVPAQETKNDRPLTRKERRELERKARADAAAQEAKVQNETPAVVETPEEPVAPATPEEPAAPVVTPVETPVEIPASVEEASAITDDAIEE